MTYRELLSLLQKLPDEALDKPALVEPFSSLYGEITALKKGPRQNGLQGIIIFPEDHYRLEAKTFDVSIAKRKLVD